MNTEVRWDNAFPDLREHIEKMITIALAPQKLSPTRLLAITTQETHSFHVPAVQTLRKLETK